MAAKRPVEVFNRRGLQRFFKEVAAAAFKKGAVLVMSAGGYATEGGADPDNIAGIAQQDGQGGTADGDKECLVALALPEELFIMNIGGAVAIAQNQLGVKYGLVKEGDNWHVDTAEVVNVAVIIVDFIDPVGEVNGRVVVKFLDSRTLWE